MSIIHDHRGPVYDSFGDFGDYRYAFFGAAGLAVIAFASLSLARAPQREEAVEAGGTRKGRQARLTVRTKLVCRLTQK